MNETIINVAALTALKDLTISIKSLQFELSVANDLKSIETPKHYKKIRDARLKLQNRLSQVAKDFDAQVEQMIKDAHGNNDTPAH